jgi:hypothetical protein
MVGHAKSDREKKREISERKETWLQRAIEIYHKERTSSTPLSLENICRQAEKECLEKTKQVVRLSSSTLDRRLKGGRGHKEAHEAQRWLTDEETEVVIQDIILNAGRGFPSVHHRIKEHVDGILHARLGDAFPETGIGENWTSRFLSDHNDRIQAYWSKGSDHSRARAVNPNTKKHYFKILVKVIEGKGGDDVIVSELMYGSDESGFQSGVGGKERVFGPKGQQTQFQLRNGD